MEPRGVADLPESAAALSEEEKERREKSSGFGRRRRRRNKRTDGGVSDGGGGGGPVSRTFRVCVWFRGVANGGRGSSNWPRQVNIRENRNP